MPRSLALLFFSVLLLFPADTFEAAIFVVTKTADTIDGVCDADCSLREAVAEANGAAGRDDITVPAGTYLLTLADGDGETDLDVTDDADITGAAAGTTILDANGTGRVFEIANGASVGLTAFTIRNGYVHASYYPHEVGGGISNCSTCSLTLTDSIVTDNWADYGGGIQSDGMLTVSNSTISGNTADVAYGGGIHIYGTAIITNSTISGNAGDEGGGIRNSGTLTLTNSTVSGNYGPEGGGILINSEDSATIINTTVSGNIGGGILSNGSFTLLNSTVTGNSAPDYYDGAGITFEPDYAEQADIQNSIVAGNGGPTDANCEGPVTSVGHNLSDDASCSFTSTGDLVVADAMLGPLADNGGPTETHAPLTGSPAVDAGDNTACPPTDQRGEPRPVDGNEPPDGMADCDMGAVELPEPSAIALQMVAICGLALLRQWSRRADH